MPKKKSKKAKGLSPQEIQKLNRDNIDYQMKVMPMLTFDGVSGNSNQLMDEMLGKAVPLIDGLMEIGQAQMNTNPGLSEFDVPELQQTMSMSDILAQLQPEPQQPQQPAQPVQPQQQQPGMYGGPNYPVGHGFYGYRPGGRRGIV